MLLHLVCFTEITEEPDFFGHSLKWLGSRWFGAASAGAGDSLIQLFWPGTGDVYNYQEYGLTGGQVFGRALVAAAGGLTAWGAVALVGITATAIVGAPVEVPFITAAIIFITVEAAWEGFAKDPLYEWLDLYGESEPRRN